MKEVKKVDPNSYKALKKSNIETCDFCDRLFNNRYDSIIHTSTHIIIPLFKQSWYPCDRCSLFFASQDKLDTHKLSHIVKNKQDKLINGDVKKKLKDVDIESEEEDEDKEKNVEINSNRESMRSRLKFEDDFNSTGIIKDLLTKCQVNVQLFNAWDNNLSIKAENHNLGVNTKTKDDHNDSNNRNRKDDDDVILLDDIIEVKKQNGHNMKSKDHNNDNLKNKINDKFKEVTIQNGYNNGLENNDKDKKVNGNEGRKKLIDKLVIEDPFTDEYEYDNFALEEEVDKFESVDYFSLMKPGIFTCRYCSTSYPNRFSLIQHETTHIKISKGRPILCQYCDRYINGNYHNLRQHTEKYHPDRKKSVENVYKCNKCGLKYRKYRRHAKHYHPDEVLPDYDRSSKIMEVCNLCFSFFKHKINLKYVLMGNTDFELGVRHPCHVCKKPFFELKIVKRICSNRCAMRERKKVTNEERLKNIQQRLKKLNLMNKIYFFLFYLIH